MCLQFVMQVMFKIPGTDGTLGNGTWLLIVIQSIMPNAALYV